VCNAAVKLRKTDTESSQIVLLAAPPGQTRQYCHNEVFRAECSSGHVVLVTSALYGRMSLGRCVKTDFGFIGCKVDVIEHLHSRCSGRRVCNVRVPDSTLDRAKPCNEDLKSYLEVAYSCAQGKSRPSIRYQMGNNNVSTFYFQRRFTLCSQFLKPPKRN